MTEDTVKTEEKIPASIIIDEEDEEINRVSEENNEVVNEILAKSTPTNVYMGVDIGSVSFKIVLIDDQNRLVDHLWLRNKGSPIDSTKRGLKQLKKNLEKLGILEKLNIHGVCTTGSARYLIKSVIGGDLAKTEIIAHAVASSTEIPNVQTILEIGGQDSKIIILRNGIVTDFAMNSVCAAGTGSFLDHQSQRLGIPIEQFGDYATRAEESVTIAGRCGVFAESDMIHKAQMGYSKESIIFGLCEALVRNYLNNVGKGKEILEPVVFQGGVSFNAGLIRAFEDALGVKVHVPKHKILMGAIGSAILIKEEAHRSIKRNGEWKTNFRGFNILDLQFETKAFHCKGCPNRCEIVSVFMEGDEVDENGKKKPKLIARWGDRCGKWEVF